MHYMSVLTALHALKYEILADNCAACKLAFELKKAVIFILIKQFRKTVATDRYEKMWDLQILDLVEHLP